MKQMNFIKKFKSLFSKKEVEITEDLLKTDEDPILEDENHLLSEDTDNIIIAKVAKSISEKLRDSKYQRGLSRMPNMTLYLKGEILAIPWAKTGLEKLKDTLSAELANAGLNDIKLTGVIIDSNIDQGSKTLLHKDDTCTIYGEFREECTKNIILSIETENDKHFVKPPLKLDSNEKTVFQIGRESTDKNGFKNDIQVDSSLKYISRSHARIEFIHDSFQIYALPDSQGLLNKVFIRRGNRDIPVGEKIDGKAYPILKGDQILLGDTPPYVVFKITDIDD